MNGVVAASKKHDWCDSQNQKGCYLKASFNLKKTYKPIPKIGVILSSLSLYFIVESYILLDIYYLVSYWFFVVKFSLMALLSRGVYYPSFSFWQRTHSHLSI